MNPPETQYVLTPDGLHIAYQVTRNGEIDLVLMQGAAAHLELAWEDSRLTRLFERLSAFSRLIRFDWRGMGMSDRWTRDKHRGGRLLRYLRFAPPRYRVCTRGG